MTSRASPKALGLLRTPNTMGTEGAYSRLDNCVIRSKDVIEPRRGQTQVASWIDANASDTRRINALGHTTLGTLMQYGSGSTSGIRFLESSIGTPILSDVDPPSPWLRTKFAECMKRAYFTSDSGLKRIDSSGAGAAAGGPRAQISGSGYATSIVYDASGQLPLNTATLYRADIYRSAPDGAEIVGPPSGRCVLRIPPTRTANAGGVVRSSNVVTVTTTEAHGFVVGQQLNAVFDSADTDANEFTTGLTTAIVSVPSATTFTYAQAVADYTSTAAATFSLGPAKGSVVVFLGPEAVAGDVVRLWRSESFVGYLGQPSEDVYQVYEAKLVAANISAGFVVIVDNTPEVLLGKPAYFSPSVEGEGQRNETPPMARDVCALGDQLFGFNLLDPHTLELRLIATGGSVGIINNTTITFTRGADTFDIVAKTSSPTSAQFYVSTGTTVAQDIEVTALWIVDCINNSSLNTGWLRAEYISQSGDAPGSILLIATDFSTTPFTVTSDRGEAWAPYILSTGTATSSKQAPDISGWCSSKPGQPDAWPPSNRGKVGSTAANVLRGCALRDRIIVLKERAGEEATAWLLSGVAPFVRVEPLDDTCDFPLPDTAAVLDNQVFCLSSIGVVAVSESGVVNMGSPIEGEFRSVVEQAMRTRALLSTYSTLPCLASWGVADKFEHRYLLGVPETCRLPSSGSTLDQTPAIDNIWAFNSNSRAWSGPWPSKHRHAAPWTAGSSSSRLVFARDDRPGVLKEAGLDAPSVLQFSDYLGHSLYVGPIDDGDNIHLSASASGAPGHGGIQVGDALYVQTASNSAVAGFFSIVTEVVDNDTVHVDDYSGLGTGELVVLVLKAYEWRAEPVAMDNFPAEAQAQSIHWAISGARFHGGLATNPTVSVVGASEQTGDKVAKKLSRPGFGVAPFGDGPFGDGPDLHKEVCQFPKDAQRGVFHSVAIRGKEAGSFCRIHAIGIDFEVGSSRGTR